MSEATEIAAGLARQVGRRVTRAQACAIVTENAGEPDDVGYQVYDSLVTALVDACRAFPSTTESS